ncbi:transcription termination factor Rho [Georgenia satyanarayanai]|uniref:transcription termination factor Rho n=1 Tax=Georgenia satyanarayanai TaxID=860221 RepID=UPI0020402389|nr:transcription termination factor Rho [Georgenia satyanarayanai]MCM3660589.1 transcription termination factor Rho [Georgenia satyanarayanai]
MKLAELQSLAAGMGLKGTTRMRKSDLVAAIREARGSSSGAGAAAPAAGAPGAAPAAEVATGLSTDAPATAPRRGRSRRVSAEAGQPRVGGDTAEQPALPVAEVAENDGERQRPPRRERPQAEQHDRGQTEQRERAQAEQHDRGQTEQRERAQAEQHDRGQTEQRDRAQTEQRERAQAERRERAQADQLEQPPARQQREPVDRERAVKALEAIELPAPRDEVDDRREDARRADQRRAVEPETDRTGRNRRRNRDRNRKRRPGTSDMPGFDELEVTEDDVLLPVAGILDILDNYAFVRTSGYLPGPNDVYVSLNQVKKHGLRRGDAVTGAVRQPQDEQQRQKFNALVRLDSVNGAPADRARQRPEFSKLTPLYPQEPLRLETVSSAMTGRIVDLVAPIGKGQRGLIVAPPKAGKTIVMQQMANAITTNNPEVHLMVVLVDERPEEVTDMQRTVKGEVIASTFDRPASDHTIVAELAIERAKRLVELGQDVVVLLDSITRLSRAYNLAAPASGRILSGGVDASALYPPKRFFGAARNIENGGSLTIVASALVETGSKMDEVIFEEFKGTGNMELRLSRSLADKRIFPAVDVNASGTRREELLLSPEELRIVWKLRRVMSALDQQQAVELLLGKMRETRSNAEFLLTVQKTTPGMGND